MCRMKISSVYLLFRNHFLLVRYHIYIAILDSVGNTEGYLHLRVHIRQLEELLLMLTQTGDVSICCGTEVSQPGYVC
jgi:hypothetical protein